MRRCSEKASAKSKTKKQNNNIVAYYIVNTDTQKVKVKRSFVQKFVIFILVVYIKKQMLSIESKQQIRKQKDILSQNYSQMTKTIKLT